MTDMTDEWLFDTSVIVYAFDFAEEEKRKKCKPLLKHIFDGKQKGFVTNQILAELFHVLTKKIERPLSSDEADIIIQGFLGSPNWKKLNYSTETIRKAIRIHKTSKLHFWDALIAATMLEEGLFTIVTENEKDFTKIPQLRVINPFK